MHRTTITLDDALATELDAYMEASGAQSRSETIRDLVRRALADRPAAPDTASCYAVVSCVVDQTTRGLAARVPQGRLDRHDETVTALSVPLDHSTVLDVTVMRGQVGSIATYAETLFVERGVMHGSLGLIPVAEGETRHMHNEGGPHAHTHPKVLESF